MNQLVIIGNGFDLAHGLKTSYQDFIIWYLNKRIYNLANKKKFEDALIEIVLNAEIRDKHKIEINSTRQYFEILNQLSRYLQVPRKNEYFDKLINESFNGWVDIEQFYYNQLVSLYKNYIKSRDPKAILQKLTLLNSFLDGIRGLLIEYLNELDKKTKLVASRTLRERVFQRADTDAIVLLNFNYTDTINQYIRFHNTANVEVISIHGELNNSQNPAIFGYGDEIDTNYKEIEDTGVDEFLENIKSFWYMKTNNYRKVIQFINSYEYQITIAGHSCGLSDRVLLSELFINSNCKDIDILYHLRNDGSNDYTQKSYAISRQFPHEFKGDLRKKIIPFDESVPLVPIH